LPVAIVNQAFVRRFLSATDPLGRVVRQMQGPPGRPLPQWTIVGVTADAVYDSLRAPIPPTMYIVFGQIDDDLAPPSTSLTVRVAGAPTAAVTRSLAAAMATVNPDLDLTFRPMNAMLSGKLTIERTLALLAGFFGALSLLLAAIGLYGVTSYDVHQRRREIGIRMALGATRPVVVRQMLSRIVPLIAVGIAIGAAVSLWVAQFVTALLFRLPSRDPVTFTSAAAVLAGVGILAGWLPARRASCVDPMVTLRHD
jgi:ABC-type antimicrobial peptide transport system permease subunit